MPEPDITKRQDTIDKWEIREVSLVDEPACAEIDKSGKLIRRSTVALYKTITVTDSGPDTIVTHTESTIPANRRDS